MADPEFTLCPTCGRPALGALISPQPPSGPPSPKLSGAQRKLDQRQRAYDEARATWEDAMAQLSTACAMGTQSVVTADGRLVDIPRISPTELAKLEAAEQDAREARDHAGAELAEARMKYRELAARSR